MDVVHTKIVLLIRNFALITARQSDKSVKSHENDVTQGEIGKRAQNKNSSPWAVSVY